MAVQLDELLVALRLFERVQVLPLDILDERQLRDGRFVDLANDCRNRVQARPLRRSPAALPGDDLEIFPFRAKQDRLKHASLSDRIGELIERILVELNSWLVRIGPD